MTRGPKRVSPNPLVLPETFAGLSVNDGDYEPNCSMNTGPQDLASTATTISLSIQGENVVPDSSLSLNEEAKDAEMWSTALTHSLITLVEAACAMAQAVPEDHHACAAATAAVLLASKAVELSKPTPAPTTTGGSGGATTAAASASLRALNLNESNLQPGAAGASAGNFSPSLSSSSEHQQQQTSLRVTLPSSSSRLIAHDASFLSLVLGVVYAGPRGAGAPGNLAPTREDAWRLFECTPARNAAVEAKRPDLAALQVRILPNSSFLIYLCAPLCILTSFAFNYHDIVLMLVCVYLLLQSFTNASGPH